MVAQPVAAAAGQQELEGAVFLVVAAKAAWMRGQLEGLMAEEPVALVTPVLHALVQRAQPVS